jgi:hypothetical protein
MWFADIHQNEIIAAIDLGFYLYRIQISLDILGSGGLLWHSAKLLIID